MLIPTSDSCDTYDLIVVALGYEPRSRAIAERLHDRAVHRVALDYDDIDCFSYAENRRILEALEFDSYNILDLDFATFFSTQFENAKLDVFRLGIDVSSLSRKHLAAIIVALGELSQTAHFRVDFWYSLPKFDASLQPTSTVDSAGLLHPSLAGLAADPDEAVASIIGVGFEPNLALGISEYLDVASVHAFVPNGHDSKFDAATSEANSALFLGQTPCHPVPYNIKDPYDLYVRLESLVYGLGVDKRVVLAPLGPKIFSLCAIIVALQSQHPVAVWRFSGGASAARPTEASGEPVRFSVRAIARDA